MIKRRRKREAESPSTKNGKSDERTRSTLSSCTLLKSLRPSDLQMKFPAAFDSAIYIPQQQPNLKEKVFRKEAGVAEAIIAIPHCPGTRTDKNQKQQ
ncbi:hypothetical protein SUGI_0413630 [Cryptomeria japonica]|nr:hypothetical protein SUGI_0413630 [Cryptomeria japonica]